MIRYFDHTVPIGFVSDGCTLAKDSWFGKSIKNPCIYHDYLRRHHVVAKSKANRLFYKALRQEGLLLPIAIIYYMGVTLSGLFYE